MKLNFVLFKVFAKTIDIWTSNFYWIIRILFLIRLKLCQLLSR